MVKIIKNFKKWYVYPYGNIDILATRSGIIAVILEQHSGNTLRQRFCCNVFRMQMRLQHHCQKKDVAAKVLPLHIVTTPFWQYIAVILLLYRFSYAN